MRLWHKKLITSLPDKMLLSEWRELSAIVGSINKNGTPNHRLVNIILDYPKSHFYTYSILVYNEMIKRNFKVNSKVKSKILLYGDNELVSFDKLYNDWHNDRYFKQCFHNIEEKYDRGIISEEEWLKIENIYKLNSNSYEKIVEELENIEKIEVL